MPKKIRFRRKVARSNELIYKDTTRPIAGISVWEGSGVCKIVGVPLPMRWNLRIGVCPSPEIFFRILSLYRLYFRTF